MFGRKKAPVEEKPAQMIYPLKGGLATGMQESVAPDEEVLACLPSDGEALVVTDRRALIIKAGFLSGATFGRKLKTFPLEQISSVEVSRGFPMGRLQITSPGTAEHGRSSYADAREAENVINFGVASTKTSPGYAEFAAAASLIRELIAKARAPQKAAVAVSDPAAELERWAGLRDKGIITPEEFEAKKKQLMGL